MRYQIRPLPAWTDPETPERRSAAMFRANWRATLQLLGRETEHLGATLVVIQVVIDEIDLRQDGMLRARADVRHPGAVISFDSHYGPLRYGTDAYEQRYTDDMPSWQANVRAIALAMEALRAVDRYGVSRRGEQYVGWRALPAAPGEGFASAEAALSWMRDKAGDTECRQSPKALYRQLARQFHPDVTGDGADWGQLAKAWELLELAGGDR